MWSFCWMESWKEPGSSGEAISQPLNDRKMSRSDVQVRCFWLITYFLGFPSLQKALGCLGYKFLEWNDIWQLCLPRKGGESAAQLNKLFWSLIASISQFCALPAQTVVELSFCCYIWIYRGKSGWRQLFLSSVSLLPLTFQLLAVSSASCLFFLTKSSLSAPELFEIFPHFL